MRNCTYYRKKMIIHNQSLNYLDERPITQEERRLTEAWKKGGKEAEQQERTNMFNEKQKIKKEYAQGLLKNKTQQKQQKDNQYKKGIQMAEQEITRIKENIKIHKDNGMPEQYLKLFQEEIEEQLKKIDEINQLQNGQQIVAYSENQNQQIFTDRSDVQQNDKNEIQNENTFLDDLD